MGTATFQRAASARRGAEVIEGLFYGIGPYLLLIGLWEGMRFATGASQRLMPSVGSMVGAVQRVIANGMLLDFMYHSVARLAVAGFISTVVGVVIGISIGFIPTVANYVLPILRYFNSLSGIAWLPLFLLWFGFNEKTAIATISYTFIFPVAFNTIIGVRMVPRVLRHAVLTMGGSWWHIVWQVLIPGTLPSVISGVRLGFGYGWRAVIAAEMLIGLGGLGTLIFKAQAVNLTDRILAGMMIIGVLWSVMDYLILQPLETATIQRWGLAHR